MTFQRLLFQMRRMNVTVGRKFRHRLRLICNIEGKPTRLVPNSDRFDEITRRELTVTHGAQPPSRRCEPSWDRQFHSEKPFFRSGKFWKLHNIFPDRFGRRINFNDGEYHIFCQRAMKRFSTCCHWQNEQYSERLSECCRRRIGNRLTEQGAQ